MSVPQKIVQSSHAVIETCKFANVSGTPNIVVLSSQNEKDLRKHLTTVAERGIKCYAFFEPDIGNQMTAFSTRPVTQDERVNFREFKLIK